MDGEIDVSWYRMGDKYALVLSDAIRRVKVSKLIVKENMLTDFGVSSLLKRLDPKTILHLDLSDNKVTIKSIRMLSKVV